MSGRPGRRSARLANAPPPPVDASGDELTRLMREGNRANREAAAARKAVRAAATLQTTPGKPAPSGKPAEPTPGTGPAGSQGRLVSDTIKGNVTGPTPGPGSAGSQSPVVPENADENASSNPKSPARPRPSGYAQEPSKPKVTTSQQPAKTADPCQDLESLLKQLRAEALIDRVTQPANLPALDQNLDENVIWRAIAAVTEAISNTSIGTGSAEFTLVDQQTFALLRSLHGSGIPASTIQQVARPGNEALIVRLDGGHRLHYSLLHLQRTSNGHFLFQAYDSANGNFHRNSRVVAANEIRSHLFALGWNRATPKANIATGARMPNVLGRQRNGWECGVYVVVYAWALALGLNISGFQTLIGARGDRFLARAIDLIRLALQGFCSSAVVEAFLKCFEVVPKGATISAGRQFERTVPFLTENALREHIARLRLQHDLPHLRYLDTVLSTIRAATPGFFLEANLWDRTADEVEDAYGVALSMGVAHFPTESSPGPADYGQGDGDASGSTAKLNDSGDGAGPDMRQPAVGDTSSGPKKPTDNGTAAATSDSTGQQASEPTSSDDPCAQFAKDLAGLQENHDLNDPANGNLMSGAQARTQLADETVYRAIAAVTEAISETTNGPQYSLLSLHSISLPTGSEQRQRIARPGNPALIPHTANGHTSLFSLEQRVSDGPYVLHHYDSAGSGHTTSLHTHAAQIQHHLQSLQWAHNNAELIQPQAIPRSNATRQSHGWECGMHTIFYAWAIALGLRVNGNGSPAPANSFLEHGRHLINFALRGRVGSDTILSFLQCYGLVARAQSVPEERGFMNTVGFPEQTTLERRIARLRVEEDLDQLRQTDPTVPTTALIGHLLPEAEELYLTLDGRQVLDYYRELTQLPSTPPLVGMGGGSANISPALEVALAQIAEMDAQAGQASSTVPGTTTEAAPTEPAATPAGNIEDSAGSPHTPNPSGGSTQHTASPRDPSVDAGPSSGDEDDASGPPPGGGVAAPPPPPPAAPLSSPPSYCSPLSTATPTTPINELDTTANWSSTATPPTEPSSEEAHVPLFQAAIAAALAANATTTTTVTAPGPADPLDAEAQAAGPSTSSAGGSTATLQSDPSPSVIQTQMIYTYVPAYLPANLTASGSANTLLHVPPTVLSEEESLQASGSNTNSNSHSTHDNSAVTHDATNNEGDSLFGEEDDNGVQAAALATATSPPRPTTQGIPPALTIVSPVHSLPGLALPPPTPRNTASALSSPPGQVLSAADTSSSSVNDGSNAPRKRCPEDDGNSQDHVTKKMKIETSADAREEDGGVTGGLSDVKEEGDDQDEILQDAQSEGGRDEMLEEGEDGDLTQDLNRILNEDSEVEDEADGSAGSDLVSILQRHGVDHRVGDTYDGAEAARDHEAIFGSRDRADSAS